MWLFFIVLEFSNDKELAYLETLAQYVDRIHRAYEGKESVEVNDYVDYKEEVFMKMYEKRLKGYKSLGYSTVEEAKREKQQLRLF